MRNGYSQKRLEENPAWKGDDATYSSLHKWVVRNWGRAESCETCGTESAKVYDWSNKDGKYTRNRGDWQTLCRHCHMTFDYAVGLRRGWGRAQQ